MVFAVIFLFYFFKIKMAFHSIAKVVLCQAIFCSSGLNTCLMLREPVVPLPWQQVPSRLSLVTMRNLFQSPHSSVSSLGIVEFS